MTTTLSIDLGARSYDLLIGMQLLGNLGEHISQLLPIPKVIMVTDDHVAPLYLRIVEDALTASGIQVNTIILKAGERSKSFGGVEWLIERIFDCQPERKTTLLALGGGVVGDVTGFVASIVLRGIPFIQIPTTLLAQVDSSVGGKTGINTKFGKNLVGSFYQPKRVVIDIGCLDTLPERQFLAGYAEVVKYGLIQDARFFEWLDSHVPDIKKKDKKALQHIVEVSCNSKATIVAGDEKESNIRALLNFGHTFGHALEAVTGYKDVLLHGEAVAIGMVIAAQLSVKLGICPKEVPDAIIAHLKQMGLPTSLSDVAIKWDREAIFAAMQQDKKVSEGKMVFVVLEGMGKAVLKNNIDEALVKDVLQHA